MAHTISRVDARARLKPRRAPYWQNLERGRQLGFRLMSKGGAGTWLARFYDGEKYVQTPLGEFPLPEKERFDAAKRAAEKWFDHLDKGGTAKSTTVKAACAAYVAKLRADRREKAATDVEGRFKRLVDKDPIGSVKLTKLALYHVAEWKQRVLKAGGSEAAYNRNATALRAALNLAHKHRAVASNHAWRDELAPKKDVDGRRTLYLDSGSRKKLLEEASDEVRPFLQALTLIPLRPGELAALKVEDLDVRHKELRVPGGKTRRRRVPLGEGALTHLKACAQGQHPAAWLVRRASGGQWKKEAWRDEVKLAAKGARLPAATVAYTLRHSVITDLVTGGLDLFHVAKLAGTSVLMVEKHYGQLQDEHARAALEQLALA